MKSKILNSNSIDSLIFNINTTINNNFSPTLAFVFVSVYYDLEKLNRYLSQYDFLIIGSTTFGEIYANSELGVNLKDRTITVMLVDIDINAVSLIYKEKDDNNNFYSLGLDIANIANSRFNNCAILTFTAGLYFDNDSYLQGLQTEISCIFGAVAGDDKEFKNTYVMVNNRVIDSGVVALCFNTNLVDIVISRGFGWGGIGTQQIVTDSYKNIVYTINDKPAIEFYKNYLHITKSDMPDMGADYPLEIELKSGQILYRAPIQINSDGSLVFTGHVKQNSKVRISVPMGIGIIEHVQKSIEMALSHNKEFIADFVLAFPCGAHKNLLGEFSIKEIEAVYGASKYRPLVGFYAYGEIALFENEDTALYSESFITVHIKEKKDG